MPVRLHMAPCLSALECVCVRLGHSVCAFVNVLVCGRARACAGDCAPLLATNREL